MEAYKFKNGPKKTVNFTVFLDRWTGVATTEGINPTDDLHNRGSIGKSWIEVERWFIR